MAKKIGLLVVVCACLLTPTLARADDGGFWDMFWNWDLKMMGGGSEFHLLCLDASGNRIPGCDDLYRHIRTNPFNTQAVSGIQRPWKFSDIKHEFNFRWSVLYSYGDKVPDKAVAPGNDDRAVALGLVGIYNYRIKGRFDLGAGGGAIPVFRLSNGVVWRPTATFAFVATITGPFYVRVAENYYGNTITALDLGHPTSSFSAGPEWGPSFTFGWDLRRGAR